MWPAADLWPSGAGYGTFCIFGRGSGMKRKCMLQRKWKEIRSLQEVRRQERVEDDGEEAHAHTWCTRIQKNIILSNKEEEGKG